MKIGTVPYINSLPLTYFLPASQLIKLFPSELPNALLAGKIDCALLPVYSIIKNNLQMHPDAGIIGCDGTVGSVGFFTRHHIEDLSQIRSVYLDRESLTSVYLAKIILKKFFNISLNDLEFFHHDNCEMADAQLLIGDKALLANKNDPTSRYWDLGEIWQQHTGLGFMFACWASQRRLSDEEILLLQEARDQGVQQTEILIGACEETQRKIIRDYLSQKIIYTPIANIKEGFRQYRDLLKEYHYSEPRELKVA